VTARNRLFCRSAATIAVAIFLSASVAQAVEVAASGPCAVAPDREPCAGGACAKSSAKARNRFSPDEVGAGPLAGRNTPLPNPDAFSGPGTCADPSAGCGPPRTVTTAAVPRAPSSGGVAGPVAPPVPPTPPVSPPPTVIEPPPGPVLPPGVPAP
jgi:hypothetical protein